LEVRTFRCSQGWQKLASEHALTGMLMLQHFSLSSHTPPSSTKLTS